MKLTDFVKKQAVDAGIDVDTNEELKAIINNTAIADIEIAPGVANIIFSNLMTEESAKANPKVKAAIMANALNPLDTKIEELAGKYGLNDKWAEYKNANVRKNGDGRFNTYDTAEKFTEFLVSEEKNKVASGISSDKQKLIKDIEDLNGQMLNVKTSYEQQLKAEREARINDKKNWEIDSIFNSYQYVLEDVQKLPKAAASKLAKDFVMGELEKKGLKIERDETGNLSLFNAENAQHFEQNRKVTVADFTSKVLTDNNFLTVSKKTEGRQSPGADFDRSKLNNGQNAALNKLDSLIQEAEQH